MTKESPRNAKNGTAGEISTDEGDEVNELLQGIVRTDAFCTRIEPTTGAMKNEWHRMERCLRRTESPAKKNWTIRPAIDIMRP